MREELEEARQEAEQAEERHGAAVAKLREELQEKQRALEEVCCGFIPSESFPSQVRYEGGGRASGGSVPPPF